MYRSAAEFEVPEWEKESGFDPLSNATEVRGEAKWTNLRDSGYPFEDSPTTGQHPRAEEVLKSDNPFSLKDLPLRDPKHFICGQLSHCIQEWKKIIDPKCDDEADKIFTWIENGVDANDFFKHHSGKFRGELFNSSIPPNCYLRNSDSCMQLGAAEISSILYERLTNGSVKLLGKMGECEMPRLILPLIVEPTKKRLCLDARFLNLWTKMNSKTHLDTLRDVKRMVNPNTYMIKTDEKNGYCHVRLNPESQTFFGFQFGGYVMTCTTLPFGWKASPFVYQSIGIRVASYLRKMSIRNFLYIDDRLAVSSQDGSQGLTEARKIAYAIVEILTRLGYTLSLDKCCLKPKQCIRYLGVDVDSVEQRFLLSVEKGRSFEDLRNELIKSTEKMDVRLVRKFVGKCISYSHTVPACKLISKMLPWAGNTSNRRMANKLRGDFNDFKLLLKYCGFVNEWVNISKWLPEYGIRIDLYVDLSHYHYCVGGKNFSGSWPDTDVVSKRDYAIYQTVKSLSERFSNSRIYIYLDDTTVDSTSRRNKILGCNLILKDVLELVTKFNIDLNIKSVANSEAFRTLLSEESLRRIEKKYGPNPVDLLALECNCMRSESGTLLRHFTPYLSEEPNGVNFFCQHLNSEDNFYVFPEYGLIFPLLCLFKEQKIECTIVVPKIQPFHAWWPLLKSATVSSFELGSKSETGIVKVPCDGQFVLDDKGLKYPLHVHRVSFRNLKI